MTQLGSESFRLPRLTGATPEAAHIEVRRPWKLVQRRSAVLRVCAGSGSAEYREGMAQQPDDSVPESGSPEDTESQLAAYDLDGDGEVSAVEGIRAELGVLDARLEEVADEGGLKGKIAEAAHHVVDRLDND